MHTPTLRPRLKTPLRLTRLGAAAAALLLLLAALLPGPVRAAGGAAPITVSFDHLATGFELDGMHRNLPCESCHLNAVFKGTPRYCGVCHIQGSTFNAMPKTQTHMPTTNNCAACHDTASFRPEVHFDHTEVLGGCIACHNGTIAQGEGSTHPATSQACQTCHTVMSWNPPKAVDHTQIPLAVAGYCIICHNGTQASGKTPSHVPTNLECGDCHLTANWLNGTFDHTGITTGCVNCHDGVKAVGKQGGHMATSNLCENCHTTGLGTKTPSWAPSGFDHTQMSVSTCQTCHSGSVKISTGFVSGQPSNHVPPIPSSVDCGVCHGNNPAAETWMVLASSIATLHSGLNTGNCQLCHGGETFAGVPAPYIPMSVSGVSPIKKTPLSPPHIPVLVGADCSGCHGAAYQAGGFGPATAMNAKTHTLVSATCDTCHETGSSFYTGSGTALQLRPADHLASTSASMKTGDCSGCHETNDWNSTAMPAGHMPNPANNACTVCHTSAPTDYTPATLAANAVLHTGISGGCAQCHGGSSALTWYNNYTPKDGVLTPAHIPYTAGSDCSVCHSSTTYAVGGFGPMNMTQAKHAFVPTTCNTCHEAGLTFYMGAASPALQGRPTDHNSGQMAAPNDCSICHTTANWNSTAMPTGHMPNPASQKCTVCHTSAPADYSPTTLAANTVLHTGISSGCITCHGAPNATPPVFYNNFTPKSAVLAPVHIPTGATSCENCHTPSVFTSFGGTTMTAAKHTAMFAFIGNTCDACHNRVTPALSFYGVTNLTVRPTDHNSGSMATNDCSGCHNPNSWGGDTAARKAAAQASTHPTIGVVVRPGAPGAVGPAAGGRNAARVGRRTGAGEQAAPAGPRARPGGKLSHAGVTANCASCHNGALAAGKPAQHITSNATCENCHTTIAWNPARFEHRGVSGSCSSCHNGVNAQGRPAQHVQSTKDCGACHGTLTFAAARFDHLGVSTACQSCHNGIAAIGKQAQHPLTLQDCASCHNTLSWMVVGTPAAAPPRGGGPRPAAPRGAPRRGGEGGPPAPPPPPPAGRPRRRRRRASRPAVRASDARRPATTAARTAEARVGGRRRGRRGAVGAVGGAIRRRGAGRSRRRRRLCDFAAGARSPGAVHRHPGGPGPRRHFHPIRLQRVLCRQCAGQSRLEHAHHAQARSGLRHAVRHPGSGTAAGRRRRQPGDRRATGLDRARRGHPGADLCAPAGFRDGAGRLRTRSARAPAQHPAPQGQYSGRRSPVALQLFAQPRLLADELSPRGGRGRRHRAADPGLCVGNRYRG